MGKLTPFRIAVIIVLIPCITRTLEFFDDPLQSRLATIQLFSAGLVVFLYILYIGICWKDFHQK